jgi:hypothetical protein
MRRFNVSFLLYLAACLQVLLFRLTHQSFLADSSRCHYLKFTVAIATKPNHLSSKQAHTHTCVAVVKACEASQLSPTTSPDSCTIRTGQSARLLSRRLEEGRGWMHVARRSGVQVQTWRAPRQLPVPPPAPKRF